MKFKDFFPPILIKIINYVRYQASTRKKYSITTNDYDAQKYWDKRHRRFGYNTLLGVGHEGLSEDENYAWYEAAKFIFTGMLRELNVDTQDGKVLELGFGNGFYSKIIEKMGFTNYLGVDISDYHITHLENEIPTFKGKFKKADVGIERIDFKLCSIIFMIDVSQHIVNDDKMIFCLKQNVRANLKKDGVFIVTDELENKKYSFYEVSRSIEFYTNTLGMRLFHKPIQFRDKFIFSLKGCKEAPPVAADLRSKP